MSKAPIRRLPRTAVLLFAVAALPAAAQEESAAPPDWYLQHNDFLARDGGVFHAENPHRSEAEPWEAYGLAWEKGPSGKTLRGRLFGLRDGEDAATFWEFFVYWHPGDRKAYVQQVGGDGTVGSATLEPLEEAGTYRSEATFFNLDGSTARIAHVSRDGGDAHATESFRWADGSWEPMRSYVWRRMARDADAAR